MIDSRLANVWMHMHMRCYAEDNKQYKDYGGRGIEVSEEFGPYKKFYEWSIKNGYEKGLQLDRINNNGNYSPENCRWATRKENSRNRRSNRLVEAFGETKCLVEWSEDTRCVVTRSGLLRRLDLGWPPEEAITVKKRSHGHSERGRRAPNTRQLTAFGETKDFKRWAEDERSRVSYKTLDYRIRNGWSAEKAISTPPRVFAT